MNRTERSTDDLPFYYADISHIHMDVLKAHHIYHRLQEQTPVLYDAHADCWMLFRHEDVQRLLMDSETFSAGRGKNVRGYASRSITGIVERQFLFLDGEEHNAVQQILRKSLGQRANQLTPFLEQYISTLLEPLHRTGSLDLVTEFSAPLSRFVIAYILGVPIDDENLLRDLERWSDAFADVTSGHRKTDLKGILQLYDYFASLLQEKRKAPDDDVLSQYLLATDQGIRSAEEVISDCMMLFAAGRTTVRKLIPFAMWDLLSQDADWVEKLRRELKTKPRTISVLVEEMLRRATPTTHVARWTTRSVTFGEYEIPANKKVFGFLDAANTDNQRFSQPKHIDLARHPNRHLTFGDGIHLCVGAPIARKVAQLALSSLLSLPHLQLASSDIPPLYPNANIGGFASCRVVLR